MVQTVTQVISVRESLWQAVTAVLPIVLAQGEIDPREVRSQYQGVFVALDLHPSSERDLAILAGAVETAKWVGLSAEMAGVDPELFWQQYLMQMQG